MLIGADEDPSLGNCWRGQAALAQPVSLQKSEFPTVFQHYGLPGLVQQKDFPVTPHRGCGKDTPDSFLPDQFACPGIDADYNAVLGGHVNQLFIIKKGGDVWSTSGDAPCYVSLRYVSLPSRSNRHI